MTNGGIPIGMSFFMSEYVFLQKKIKKNSLTLIYRLRTIDYQLLYATPNSRTHRRSNQ